MKKIFFLFGILMGILGFSQTSNASVEKSVTGLQIGFLGVDIYNELKISDAIALRSQFSLNPSIWGGDLYTRTNFAFSPSISLMPKYYYNTDGRVGKGKNITNNSANYLALKIEYFPDWFVISNADNVMVNDAIYFTPNYGIRRNFGKQFNYEFRIGLGIGKILKDNYPTQLRPDLSFKIGYDF
ncbi:hypothetical protein [Soonwooa sp.]|uniref:hypothetical protein n=1 Tax=Soonwooa sp. TaxID=1938592 RepID=UPI0028A9BCC2|nr:hypothetical protein [Soonwooa sp.]